MTAPTPISSPVTDHLLRQLQDEEAGTVPDSIEEPRRPGINGSADTNTPAQTSANLTELTGLETMARPWRLLLLGLGAAVGLIAWLVVANGQATLGSSLVSVAAVVATLFVGSGLLAVANERDRLGPNVNALAVAVGLAYAVVIWLNPTPLDSVDRWLLSQRVLLSLVGFGAGLVLAGVICLATLRRSPTLTVALSIIAGVLVLIAVTALRQNEWAGVVLFSSAFFLVLGAWDRSPRREVAFEHPPDTPRAARAALSLSILALSGSAIDYARHSVNRVGWWLPGVVLAAVLIAFAISVLFRLRSDLENRDTRLSDWTSWMREIRTNEFRRGFENMAAAGTALDAPFADLGEPLRAETDMTESIGAYEDHSRDQVGDMQPHPEATEPRADVVPTSPAIAPRAEVAPAAAPDDSDRRPFDFATAAGAEPSGFDTQPTSPVEATTADVPEITIPTADASEPTAATPAPVDLYQAPRPTGNGAFSVFAQPEPISHKVPDAEAFASWLASSSSERPALFIAIECMYLSTFSELSPAYQSRVVAKVAALLNDLSPRPHPIAWIDGPYFLAAVSSFEQRHVGALNRQLQELLGSELVFDEVSIPLRGTLALLTPRETVGFDQLLDDAVNGLIHARQLET